MFNNMKSYLYLVRPLLVLVFFTSIFIYFVYTNSNIYSIMESKRNLELYYFYNKHYDRDYIASRAVNVSFPKTYGCIYRVDDLMITKQINEHFKNKERDFTVTFGKQNVYIRVVSEKSYIMEDIKPDGSYINSVYVTNQGKL